MPWYKGKIERFLKTWNYDLMHGSPGTTFSNILERDDYDSGKHAVVLLSTFREILHKWIVDVYMQTPDRGIQDIPAHRWRSETTGLPLPLPPSARALDVVLGITVQRVAFHYGIELQGLKYNGPELGELRRRMGPAVKVELTFDPGDLGQIHVLDPQKGTYLCVPALDQSYAKGLSLWQNRVIRRYSQDELKGRTDMVALAQAKAEIRELIERDFQRKSTHGRKRHARFLENYTSDSLAARVVQQPVLTDAPGDQGTGSSGMHDPPTQQAQTDPHLSPSSPLARDDTAGRLSIFTDEEILPVFEAALDLPRPLITPIAPAQRTSATEEADG